jgi:hypothetical protein
MDDDEISRAIDELEHGLAHDDPAFLQRMNRLPRTEIASVLTVSLLLAIGAVLLTVGFATRSWPSWIAGALTLLASVAADHCHHRTLE